MVETIVVLISDLLSREEVLAAITLFLVGLVSRANLERIPFFGLVVRILGRVFDQLEANATKAELEVQTEAAYAQEARIRAASSTAHILVSGQEQLKKINKTDSATAAATVTHELQSQFGLDRDMARVITEAAVRDLPKTGATEEAPSYQ